MTISSYNPIHSVFWLVLVFLQSSILLVSLSYEFLGLMLVIIYVGAIAILFLFVIMMLDIFQISTVVNFNNILPISFLLISQVLFMSSNFSSSIKFISFDSWFFLKENQISLLSKTVYNDLGFVFLVISILLLVAMVGAIILTLEVNEVTRKQKLSFQHHRNDSWT